MVSVTVVNALELEVWWSGGGGYCCLMVVIGLSVVGMDVGELFHQGHQNQF